MTLYKQPKSKNWYMRYTNEHGLDVRKSTRTADKNSASILLSRELEAVEKRKLGFGAPSPIAASKPIQQHIDSYLDSMQRDGLSDTHVYNHGLFLRRMAREMRWRTVKDIKRTELKQYLAGPLSHLKHKSHAEYINAARQLCKWCIAQEPPIMSADPTQGVLPRLRGKRARMAREQQLNRRPLTTREMGLLLNAAPDDPMSSWRWFKERLPIYAVAMMTGYRRSTLRQLRVKDVRLDAVNPQIVVPPHMTKSGRAIRTPISDPRLVEHIRSLCALASARKPSHRFYNIPFAPVPRMETFRKDLARAGIDRYDEHGLEVVFHSLRSTFCTQLAINGTHISVAMQLMDHTDMGTTNKYYTYVGVSDAMSSIQNLPSLASIAALTTDQGMPETMPIQGHTGATRGAC